MADPVRPTCRTVTRHADMIAWQATVRACDMIGEVLDPIAIGAALTASTWADTVGPMLDPTLWLRAQVRHDACRSLLKAALDYSEAHRKFRELMAGDAADA